MENVGTEMHPTIANQPFQVKQDFLIVWMENWGSQGIVDVHTLNHDLFLERLNITDWLQGNLCDGFEEMGSPYYGKLRTDDDSYMVRLARYTGFYPTNF